jgi:hypothetical protein
VSLHFGEGYVKADGYVAVKVKQVQFRQHRLVVEEFLGRRLLPDETVHHISDDKADNRVENLYLFPTKGAHSRYHRLLRFGKVSRIVESNLNL